METGLSRTESQAAIEGQNWRLLGYFNYYRLTIALAAVVISFFIPEYPAVRQSHPDTVSDCGARLCRAQRSGAPDDT